MSLLSRRCVRGSATTIMAAKSRGVVIGGDNSGTVTTGDEEPPTSSRSQRAWLDVAAAISTLLGLIVAVLAWWLPRAP